MTKEQLKKIMDAMQGITYLDWEKLSLCIMDPTQEAIDQLFEAGEDDAEKTEETGTV